MKRSAVLAALTACLLGAGLRVQLVAQEKSNDVPAAESTAAAKEPTLPKVPREELRYDGKSFEDWQRVFQTELKTERRVEAIGAMWQFACNGYAQEAAETLVAVAGTLKQDPLGRTDTTLRETIESTLAAMEPAVVVPLLKSLLEPTTAEPTQEMALRVMAKPKLRQETTLDDLAAIASDKNRPASVRSQAIRLIAGVNRPDREILPYVRALVADSGNPMALREWMDLAVPVTQFAGGQGVNSSYFPMLIDGIASENSGLRDDAVMLIREMGPHIQFILPDLLELARDGKEAMAKSAAEAIVANGNADPASMQVLYQKLDAPERVQLLKVIAPHYADAKAPGWIDFFRSLRDDDNPEIRTIAEQVMESVRDRAGAAGSEQRASRAKGGR